jgi:hypothetical protein
MANNNNNKEDYESTWDILLTMGVWKTLLLMWCIYTPIYIIAMVLVYWFTKR